MSLRTAQFCTDLLVAEVFAAPFWMPEGLESGLVQLQSQLSHDDGTRRLHRATEAYIMQRFPSTGIDELLSVRDRLWFPAGARTAADPHKFSLHDVALALARTLVDSTRLHADSIDLAGRTRRVGARESNNSRIRLFRRQHYWLTTALPGDFLRVLLRLESSRNPSDRNLRVSASLTDSRGLAKNVSQMLRAGGMAESHLHLGAAFRFTDLWTALMQRVASADFKPDAFHSTGAAWDEGRQLSDMCVHAGILRWVLARYLNFTMNGEEQTTTFSRFAASLIRSLRTTCGHTVGQEVERSLLSARSGQWRNSAFDFRSAQAAYRRLAKGILRQPHTLQQLREQDPVLRFLRPREFASAELQLCYGILSVLMSGAGSEDVGLAGCFWQYQRIRNAVYRHWVHRPMSPGLLSFVRHFDRLSPAKSAIRPMARLESAWEVSGGENGLTSLEVRTSPDSTFTGTLGLVRDVYQWTRRQHTPPDESDSTENQPRRTQPVEAGLVFHVVRDRGGSVLSGNANGNGLGTEAEPGFNQRYTGIANGLPEYGAVSRFHRFYNRTLRSVRHVERTLLEFPLSLQVIRGFDACTDELGIPLWMIVPFFRSMRMAAAQAQELLRVRFGRLVPLPGSTIHAGEDFVHIVTGLRHLDEAINWLSLEEGDRIGHAMALGIAADEWAHRTGAVTMTAEQHLMDLVWEWDLYGQRHLPVSVSRLRYLESTIAELAEFVFGPASTPAGAAGSQLTTAGPPPRDGQAVSPWPPTAQDLVALRQDLAEPELLTEAGMGQLRAHSWVAPERRKILLREYLFRRDIFRRGQRNIVVSSDAWAEDLASVQQTVREKIERLNIAIEVNPSSNLLIGDLGDMTQHPLWRLNSPDTFDAQHSLPIVIGSDDPVTFSSNLPLEYQKLADALSSHGYSETATLKWLDAVRATGLRYRFTLPASEFMNHRMTRWK